MPTPDQLARLAISLTDLTSLNDDDTAESVASFCKKAATPAGNVAAICIFPQFIQVARQSLDNHGLSGLPIATVTNFPAGGNDLQQAMKETEAAVAAGADEVDIVLPYSSLEQGTALAEQMVSQAKALCGSKALLKVIIESGELQRPELITLASELSLANGADFIKTSTGKVPVNATLEAARLMLEAIRNSGRKDAGFKAAGGVRTLQDASDYLSLATDIMGEGWVSPARFRFGASGLLDNLLKDLGLQHSGSSASY